MLSRPYKAKRAPVEQIGFTLIEVMVAIAILAMTLPALIITMSTQLDSMSYLKEKSAAYWLAENEINKIRLEKIITNKLPKGRTTETEEFGGREWTVNTEAVEIDYEQFDAKLVQVDVRVRPELGDYEDDYWLASMRIVIDSAPEKAQPKLPDSANVAAPANDGKTDGSNNNGGSDKGRNQPTNPAPARPGQRDAPSL